MEKYHVNGAQTAAEKINTEPVRSGAGEIERMEGRISTMVASMWTMLGSSALSLFDICESV